MVTLASLHPDQTGHHPRGVRRAGPRALDARWTERAAPKGRQAMTESDQLDPPNRMAEGIILFAGVIMILKGGFQALVGLITVSEDDFYLTTPKYLLDLSPTAWGWIHLVLSVVVVVAGIALIRGVTWARVAAVVLAGVSALSNFAFIPYHAVWPLTIIALDILVIWAVVAHGGRNLTTLTDRQRFEV
jgi:uncharacterized membrane protein YphA (DoxX/SURF4 family)